MNDVVIRAENLGKKYLIGHQAKAERYTALRDVAARTVKGLVRSARDIARGRQLVTGDEVEEFWALKDVEFEIKRGDVVGIIGRNGAGKSTLLKILSRITEPSTGRVEIRGRVASLLEVGTGFHPELTGRENIFLNGAILGMNRAEIRRKFDEIVAFAEVEKFLDTPVKHYSSGMYVRLAFAVAAHLEPEILVVDEVLAVGDAEFQKKSLGKMHDVADQGRTVLFVSHNMAAVSKLCSKGILLRDGGVIGQGSVQQIIDKYHRTSDPLAQTGRYEAAAVKRIPAQIASIEMLDGQAQTVSHFASGQRIFLNANVDIRFPLNDLSFAIFFRHALSQQFLKTETDSIKCAPGQLTLSFEIDHLPLTPGEYFVSVGLANRGVAWIEHLDDVLSIEVTSPSDSEFNMGRGSGDGWVATKHRWKIRQSQLTE